MSRIEDVFKRITGAAPDPRPASALERYEAERTAKPEENRVTTFVAAGPHAVEPRPPIRRSTPSAEQAAPSPVKPPSHHQVGVPVGEDLLAANDKLVDVEKIFDYVGFLARSLRRHPFLALGTFAVVLGLTMSAAMLLPKTYFVSTKLLAQRNAVMTALSNPGRAVPWDADAPTRAAAETVLRRDNLIALIEKTDLMREWESRREPILRLKDRILALITRHQPTAEDKLESMILLLESRMNVVAGPVGDGTVTIDLLWRDPEMGFRLVDAAQAAFLDARQKAETNAINEAIRILEDYSQELHDNVNVTLAELERTQRRPSSYGRAAAARPMTLADLGLPPEPAGGSGVTSLGAAIGLSSPGDVADANDAEAETAQLRTKINSKKQEIVRLKSEQDRQIAELQTQLSRLTAVFAPAHPSVMTVQQNLAAVSHDSPQLVRVQAEVEELERELKSRENEAADRQIRAVLEARSATASASVEPEARTPEPPPPPAAPIAPSVEPPSSEFASLRLRSELNQLESVLERTDGARIELKVSQAAFKYRYTVIRPAQAPKEPVAPNLKRILLAGLIGSLIIGVLSAVGTDLLRNRILETWQVERQLGLPVLGTVESA